MLANLSTKEHIYSARKVVNLADFPIVASHILHPIHSWFLARKGVSFPIATSDVNAPARDALDPSGALGWSTAPLLED